MLPREKTLSVSDSYLKGGATAQNINVGHDASPTLTGQISLNFTEHILAPSRKKPFDFDDPVAFALATPTRHR